jgi:hypothetical protein
MLFFPGLLFGSGGGSILLPMFSAPPRRKTYEQETTRELTPDMNKGVKVLA